MFWVRTEITEIRLLVVGLTADGRVVGRSNIAIVPLPG